MLIKQIPRFIKIKVRLLFFDFIFHILVAEYPVKIEMRFLFTFVIAVLYIAVASGQDLKQQVLASAGGYNISGDNSISLSWTLGELVITTVESGGGDLILTQGFQQTKMAITAVKVNKDLGIEVTVFPNPTSELVNIKFTAPLDGETLMFLTAPDGRQVMNSKIEPGMMLKQIDIHDLAAGTYYLRIQNGLKYNVYKILKLQGF
jgi:hypothetical protein